MRIDFYTNLVYGGWSAKQLESGIGGSEEKLIELCEDLTKRGHTVNVYMNGEHGNINGVNYLPHKSFRVMDSRDVFVSFKSSPILAQSINANAKVHLTTEIEAEWPKYMLDNVDAIWCISNYHLANMKPKSDKFSVQYLWADIERMERNKVEKEKGSILYSSSFDRGLEELLNEWPKLKEKMGWTKLYVTYGWDFMINAFKNNPRLLMWKSHMDELLKQEGIELLGRLTNDEMCKMYWKSEYWCLPLNRPESELFCINAIKAQYAGCTPVVRKIGALQETVGECINWDELLGRQNQKSTFNDKSIEHNYEHVKKFAMDIRVSEIEQELNKLTLKNE